MDSRVKNEPIKTINLAEVMNNVSLMMKNTREGNDANTNCGYLAKYALELLEALLSGRVPVERIVTTDTSANVTTMSHVDRTSVQIKTENNKVLNKKYVTVSTPQRSDEGLHSKLPVFPSTIMMDVDNEKVSTVIDLENKVIHRTRVNTTEELSRTLMHRAEQEQRIIYGDVVLSVPGSSVGHVIVFCASEDSVFYVDAQLYNGITHRGEPVFSDFKTAKDQEGNRAYYFEGETGILPRIRKYQPICFFLEYGSINVSNVEDRLQINENENYDELFQIPKIYSKLYSVQLTSDISIEKIKEIKEYYKVARLYQTTQIQMKALPPTVTILIIGPATNVETVKVIPARFKIVIDAGAAPDVLKALPETILKVGITQLTTIDGAAAIPSTVRFIDINKAKIEVVQALPNRPIVFGISDGTSAAAVKAIPANTNMFLIDAGTSLEAVQALRDRKRVGIIKVILGSGTKEELVKALPSSAQIIICPYTGLDAIKGISENINVFTQLALRDGKGALRSVKGNMAAIKALPSCQVIIDTFTTTDIMQVLSPFVRKVRITDSVLISVIKAIPKSVMIVMIPALSMQQVKAIPSSVQFVSLASADISAKAVEALHQKIKGAYIFADLSAEVMAAIPKHIKIVDKRNNVTSPILDSSNSDHKRIREDSSDDISDMPATKKAALNPAAPIAPTSLLTTLFTPVPQQTPPAILSPIPNQAKEKSNLELSDQMNLQMLNQNLKADNQRLQAENENLKQKLAESQRVLMQMKNLLNGIKDVQASPSSPTPFPKRK